MYKITCYHADDRVEDLIGRRYSMLLVMVRFGIPLGVGDRTIGEVCQENGVDVSTFLAVVNLLSDEENFQLRPEQISLPTLIHYLQSSHQFFLGYRLPQLRERLAQALVKAQPEERMTDRVLSYFDEYVEEVHRHMDYEDHQVFTYVEHLLNGEATDPQYNIGIFSSRHDHVEEKLVELKDIILKYLAIPSHNELNSVLVDMFTCSVDLADHNLIEDHLFVPVIRYHEKRRRSYGN